MDEIKHFLETEMYHTLLRMCQHDSPDYYDGIPVGKKKALNLMARHVVFCHNLLKMIEENQVDEVGGE